MSQAAIVSRLAVRELWMSLRLFVLLAAYALAGAWVAVIPATSLAVAIDRLALSVGAAGILSAAVAAGTVAVERERGRTGWLLTRSVPRSSLLSAWFVALGGTAAAGHVVALTIGWVVALGLAAQPDLLGYLVAATATLAATLAGVGTGVLAGMALAPAPAALAAVTAVLALTLVAVGGILPASLIPGVSAFIALAEYGGAPASIGPGLLAAGLALTAAAALLVAARFTLERVDL